MKNLNPQIGVSWLVYGLMRWWLCMPSYSEIDHRQSHKRVSLFVSLDVTSGPTDRQPAGLRREEDDPSLHPNPSPRCPSAELCTPTMLRTQTSSASTLTTSSTSSKRVSAGRKRHSGAYLSSIFHETLI